MVFMIIIKALSKIVSIHYCMGPVLYPNTVCPTYLYKGQQVRSRCLCFVLPPNPAVSWPNCVPRDAIQNRTCKFRTRGNGNNDNKQREPDEANRGTNNILALIPVTWKEKEDSLHFAPTAVTHELGSFSAVVS
jgi:hypothetical protein